jgi:hypothetical protein
MFWASQNILTPEVIVDASKNCSPLFARTHFSSRRAWSRVSLAQESWRVYNFLRELALFGAPQATHVGQKMCRSGNMFNQIRLSISLLVAKNDEAVCYAKPWRENRKRAFASSKTLRTHSIGINSFSYYTLWDWLKLWVPFISARCKHIVWNACTQSSQNAAFAFMMSTNAHNECPIWEG